MKKEYYHLKIDIINFKILPLNINTLRYCSNNSLLIF